MKIASTLAFALLPFVTGTAHAQRVEPVNSLGRARATYDASDTDRNGKVSLEEFARQKLVIPRADFSAMDHDKDGTWSKEEFLVYYRRLLINSGQRASDELESEVARIQALRRAQERERARPVVTAPQPQTPAESDAAEALRIAIDELEKKAAQRKATREDFQRVKDGLVARARQMTAQDPTLPADLVSKFETAVAALESQARAGNYGRDEYASLRELLITRGRQAAQGTPPPVVTPPGANPPAPITPSAPLTVPELQARLDLALDDLVAKAQARSATRADFTLVKSAFAARARAAAPTGDAAAIAERGTLEQRFFAALDKLENDAQAGRFSREEFEKVREAYVSRVRAMTGSASESAVPATTVSPNAMPSATDELAAKLDIALDDLAAKAAARQATREDFGRVRDAMTARARALASADPAAAGRVGTLDLLFTNAMAKLEEDALAGKFSREEFQTLRESYVSRARAIVAAGAPAVPPGSIPTTPSTPPPAAGVDTIESRFESALAELQHKALSRGATREDFDRVRGLLVARARAAVSAQTGTPVSEDDERVRGLVNAFQGLMGRLEVAAQSGTIEVAEFERLRQTFIARAREATNPSPAPPPEVKPVEPRREEPKREEPKREEPKREEPKREAGARGEVPPVDPKEAETGARGRERPASEQPKPADPPREERTGRPVPPSRRG